MKAKTVSPRGDGGLYATLADVKLVLLAPVLIPTKRRLPEGGGRLPLGANEVHRSHDVDDLGCHHRSRAPAACGSQACRA